MAITLYGSTSTASLVVHWLLLELDVPHELVLLDFDTRQQKSADYLALNPAGVVPTLVMGDQVLTEAAAIALQLADLALVKAGAQITIRSSRSDQEGLGQAIAIPNGQTILPIARLKAWLRVRGDAPGPLFTRFSATGEMTDLPMSDRAVARIVQKYAALAGLDPATVG